MKAKFLPLLLLAILLQVSMFSFANEMTSARRIRLKNKTEVQHRSIPVTPDACNDRLVYVTNSYEELSRLLEYEL